ncbi:RNA-processing protein [Macleaya cordata]|uniref:RNA-processing protein n=1 Tax=Macleaya cordata TaxID=56857 RepID=A0A200R1G1_MACCD|nr:RNA-processing protein [Macleaya cordata]
MEKTEGSTETNSRGTEKEEDEQKKPSLSPLFPLSDPSTNNNSTSKNPQWLSNTSFTTELSVINQSISSHYETLTTINPLEQEEEEPPSVPPTKPSSFSLLNSSSSSSSSSYSDSDERERKNKKKKKKKRRRKRSREEASAAAHFYSSTSSRKSGVPIWAGSDIKPSKDYYFDSRGDLDNLAFGSLYRMDVARYKLCNPTESSGFRNNYVLHQGRDSLLNGEADTDSLDAKLRSGGRYWSMKYSALEHHKDFKRVKIVPTADMSELSEFIPFGDNVDDGSQEQSKPLEESWEDEVLRRTKEFNKMSRESPHDEKVWLAFAEFQDKVASKQPQKGARLQTLEKKISILEKAIELNPDNEELLLCLMKGYQRRDSNEVLTKRWERILMQHPGSYKLWKEFLRVIQGEFSRFKVSDMRKMYGHAIQALSSACAKLCRQVTQIAKPSLTDPAIIQLELGVVDIFVSLCRLEWQSGYQELATGLFQAEIEYSLFCPSLLLTEQSKQRLFEHFWDGNGARLGEDGALGWSMWLAKEEEKRQKVITEDSFEQNEEGGWTGWSEPLSTINYNRQTPVSLEDGVMGAEEVEEDLETEAKLEDDIESLLKKLGIDAEAEADSDVKDTTTWTKWSEEELKRDREQWMPVRENSAATSDDPSDSDEQLLRAILFEDVSEYLFSLCSEEARFSLVSQFIDFFGGKISQWTCTNSPSWIESTLSLDTLTDSILDDLRSVHKKITKMQSDSSTSAVECLLGSSNDVSKRTNMMKFLRNAILLCLTTFPRNHVLEEAALVAEELSATKMNSCPHSVTPSRALAKVLLKNDRQDLLLCGVYARSEAAYGNVDLARKVFDMALSSIEGLPSDLRSNAPLLYFWYAEMELANCYREGSESLSQRAIHILSCLGIGVKYITFKCQPSSLQLLRAHQGFKECIRTLRSTWARGDIKEESIALICSASMFEELTTGWTAGIGVLEEAFSMVLPERRTQSSQLESLFNYYIKMLQKHYNQSKLSRVWDSILQGLQMYPYNPKLFTALIEIGFLYTVTNKLRWILDEYCQKKPSVIVWLFALSYELDKVGSRHRIHGLFERALANEKLQNSVILWRCYIAYEIDIACNPSAAKRIFFRAIHACPWSKRLWLDGFLKLNSILTAKELSDLQENGRIKIQLYPLFYVSSEQDPKHLSYDTPLAILAKEERRVLATSTFTASTTITTTTTPTPPGEGGLRSMDGAMPGLRPTPQPL